MTGPKPEGKPTHCLLQLGYPSSSACCSFVLEFVFVHDVCAGTCMHRRCVLVRRLVNSFRYYPQGHHPPPLGLGLS